MQPGWQQKKFTLSFRLVDSAQARLPPVGMFTQTAAQPTLRSSTIRPLSSRPLSMGGRLDVSCALISPLSPSWVLASTAIVPLQQPYDKAFNCSCPSLSFNFGQDQIFQLDVGNLSHTGLVIYRFALPSRPVPGIVRILR